MHQLMALLSFPPVLLHELTHYAVARLRTDDAAFEAEVLGSEARAVWRPLDSPLWRFLAFLAPTLFGALLAGLWLASGTSFEGWRAVAGVGLALYTLPSVADIRGALGRQQAQQ
ncbi:hypothetical protein [Natronomonas pharaonis]